MFALIFRMYNFIHATRASHAKLSQLGPALLYISTATENLPRAMSKGSATPRTVIRVLQNGGL
jgi:hypothetical protein